MTKPSVQQFLHLHAEVILLVGVFAVGCSTTDQLLFSRGEEQLKKQQYAEAYETFTHYIAMDHGSSSGYYNRALACMGLDRLPDALSDLDKVLALKPDDTDAHWMRFKIHAERRQAVREDTSIASVQRPMKQLTETTLTLMMMNELDAILSISRHDIGALNERGRLKHERGEYDAALTDYDAALVLCDSCTWLMYNKALTLRALWRGREAVPLLQKVIHADSSDGDAWLLLGECFFGLGRRKEACNAFARGMQLGVVEAEERFKTLCE